ncbi:MAG: PIN domain-containing protein [Acidimicrobiales bacterium]
MAVLIDTSVLVAAERGGIELERVFDPNQQYAVSAVSAAELLYGVHRAVGRRAQLRSAYVEGLLAEVPILPVDLLVARAYARASAALARAGTRVDANDLWIGATAIANDLTVLSLDGDFDRIPGVTRAPVDRP